MRNGWQGKISNVRQLGGIDLTTLEDGRGRGTRVADFNTGSPLRFRVVIDRNLDIADAFFGRHSLAWISPCGITTPNPATHQGMEWLRAFGGGLMATCGLTHTGGPESDEAETRGLHGRISNLPASVTQIRQPDPMRGDNTMSISGVVREAQLFGPDLELRREISCTLGEPCLTIRDCVTNLGNLPAPHMILYHFNLGWPLVDEGTQIHWRGTADWVTLADAQDTPANGRDFMRCPAPLDTHRGDAEDCGFIHPEPDADGLCHAGVSNSKLGLNLDICFRFDQLPCLANWQHWGPNDYVMGLEPGTAFPEGQNAAREAGRLILLNPGESRDYEVCVRVSEDPAADWLRP
jgi:hypothetical protein